MQLVAVIDNAHYCKDNDAVNGLLSMNYLAQSEDPSDNQTNMELPFFISCGADGNIKIFEHNIYAVQEKVEDKDKEDEVSYEEREKTWKV